MEGDRWGRDDIWPAGLSMFQIVVDLGFYLRAENVRAVDDKMNRAVSHLKTLIPAGRNVRLALEFVGGLDPEHGQVRICVEAMDHKEQPKGSIQ